MRPLSSAYNLRSVSFAIFLMLQSGSIRLLVSAFASSVPPSSVSPFSSASVASSSFSSSTLIRTSGNNFSQLPGRRATRRNGPIDSSVPILRSLLIPPSSPRSFFGGVPRGGSSFGITSKEEDVINQQQKLKTRTTTTTTTTTSSSSSSVSLKLSQSDNNNNNHDDDNNNDDFAVAVKENHSPEIQSAIHDAASKSLFIAGSCMHHSTFGSIPYIDTTNLDHAVTPTATAAATAAPINNNDNKRQHRVLFVLGGPGAGKGTQCERIVSSYKCIHLSVGELLRRERERPDSEHGPLIEDCLVHGKIVPVEISLSLLKRAMDDADTMADPIDGKKYGCRWFLVDGFPRNFDNLNGWVGAMPTNRVASCFGALVYDCPVEELERRILSRAETSGRSDDNLISARKRFKTFQTDTMPVVLALEEVERIQSNKKNDSDGGGDDGGSLIHVAHIAGDKTVEEVWEETQRVMEGYVKNDVLSANARLIDAVNRGDAEAYAALCSETMLLSSQKENTKEEAGLTKGENKRDRIKSIFDAYEVAKVDSKKKTDQQQQQQHDKESTSGPKQTSTVENAEIQFHGGTKATVSYDRIIRINGSKLDGGGNDNDDEIVTRFRETSVWSHEEKGWICIHSARTPL